MTPKHPSTLPNPKRKRENGHWFCWCPRAAFRCSDGTGRGGALEPLPVVPVQHNGQVETGRRAGLLGRRWITSDYLIRFEGVKRVVKSELVITTEYLKFGVSFRKLNITWNSIPVNSIW